MRTLTIEFSYDPASHLFYAKMENGAGFHISPDTLQGKLGANLHLFLNAVKAEKEGRPHAPIVSKGLPQKDQELVDAALAAGRVTQIKSAKQKKAEVDAITLEDLGL